MWREAHEGAKGTSEALCCGVSMWREAHEGAKGEEALLHIKKTKKNKKKSGKMPLYAQMCIYNQPSDRKSGLDSQI